MPFQYQDNERMSLSPAVNSGFASSSTLQSSSFYGLGNLGESGSGSNISGASNPSKNTMEQSRFQVYSR